MTDDWRTWDIFHDRFWVLSPEDAETFKKVNAVKLGKQIGEIAATWKLAADSDPFPTPPKSYKKHHHFHFDLEVDGHAVHIDKITAMFWGPLRGFTEYRLFVDGHFAGRGGTAGGSWGSFGRDDAARAMISDKKMLVIDLRKGQDERQIELWEI
jgi:hypothetical protein